MYRKQSNLSSMLNTRIEIWHNTTVKNELGQRSFQPALFKKMWAGIIPQTGSLLNGRAADIALTRTTHKFITRFDSSVTSDMWIIHNGKRYDIIYVLDPYSNHERNEIFAEVVL